MRERDLLLVDEGAARPAAEAHAQWQKRRGDTVERGQRPSLRVETATARAASSAAETVEVASVEVRISSRPAGRRFGTLVHAVLAGSDLRATSATIASAAAAQGRLVGATVGEVEATAHAVEAALAHPLLRRATDAIECRREDPVIYRLEDGTLLEGVVDLAFRDGEGWTVVDFKTDARPESHPQYAAQILLYCRAISAATGLPSRGALLAV
jgi:ATP-dependent helicase/nuclease subunit A